ncbi:MAG: DNA replication and repair protein RecF [SAR202 cluster bacterium]|nr:DNA replication and repair protein RecF [SAR202 cluster bacterium]MDP6300600.1 DNA replication and repair protein RecF [SAR202 cluster bacterium]MDP7225385.1 DNA replication and repair protein RecF [SAR202 cluster bacterium]
MNLVNYRCYEHLELGFGSGFIMLEGDNGQGKSALLEAVYLLAIAKASRASSDRELIRWPVRSDPHSYAQVAAQVIESSGVTRLQADFSPLPRSGRNDDQPSENGVDSDERAYQKSFRVNGIGRTASSVVGILNAVMFGAEDLELVHGNPSVRRRYIDILVSQIDDRYLKSLQRYQKVLAQRNRLLKLLRSRSASLDELQFWNEELVSEGAVIMERRARSLASLDEIAAPIHSELSGADERLRLVYRPSVPMESGDDERAIGASFKDALARAIDREIAQGFTSCGPHRDDLSPLIDNVEASAYASRGQSRTIVLAMKLAEAEHLKARRGEEPVLLLDDVLSELDQGRQNLVLNRVETYEQCFVTTADPDVIPAARAPNIRRYRVAAGKVQPLTAPTV